MKRQHSTIMSWIFSILTITSMALSSLSVYGIGIANAETERTDAFSGMLKQEETEIPSEEIPPEPTEIPPATEEPAIPEVTEVIIEPSFTPTATLQLTEAAPELIETQVVEPTDDTIPTTDPFLESPVTETPTDAIPTLSPTSLPTSTETPVLTLMPTEVLVRASGLFLGCSSVTEIPPTECEALVALYDGTDGTNWANQTDWKMTDTPCNWAGVTCTSGLVPEHVTEIDLPSNGLKNSLPAELGNLSYIQNLNLNSNTLSGTIPLAIGNLINLISLNLSTNQFSGSIPAEASSLINLSSLHLSNNQFTGSLPLWLAEVPSLATLSFNNTNLCEPNDQDFQDWLDNLLGVSSEYRTNTLCSIDSITGTVTALNSGTPLEGIHVCVYTYDSGSSMGCFTTDSNGSYTATDLPAGDYRVSVFENGWAWQHYNNTLAKNNATRVTVASNSTVNGIDFALSPGGTIEGTVYQADGITPISSMNISLDGDGFGRGACTDANGHYSLNSVPLDAALKVRAAPVGQSNWCQGNIANAYNQQYWDHTASSSSATALTLTSGSSNVSGIDFTLEPVIGAGNERMLVGINTNYVEGYDWPLGSTMTLTIDDPSTPTEVDYSNTAVTHTSEWNSSGGSWVMFSLNNIYDVKTGDIVRLTDGVTTKEHTAVNIAVTGIDLDSDTVSGTGDPGLELYVYSTNNGRSVTVDEYGNWTVDFSGDLDLVPGLTGDVQYHESDGDGTRVIWGAQNPSPRVQIQFNRDYVYSYNWGSNDIPITLTIDDPSTPESVDYTASGTTGPAPGDSSSVGFVNFSMFGKYNIKPGDIVSVTDGVTTRTHTVVDISVTDINAENDTVSGTAPAGMELHVYSSGTDKVVVADTNGNWIADFSGWVDLVHGITGDVQYRDDQGETAVYWAVSNARVQIDTHTDYVQGYDWPLGSTLTLTIDDPATPASVDYTASGITNPAPWDSSSYWVEFHMSGIYDMKPGDTVSLSDGMTTRTHTAVDLSVTDVDPENDTVSGTAPAGVDLRLYVFTTDTWATTTADSNGIWTYDFTGTVDLVAGTEGMVRYQESEGETQMDWQVSNPVVQVGINTDYVQSRSWGDNTSVTMTIDDPATPASVDYSASGTTTSPAPWDSNDDWIIFQLAGIYDVKPGDIVSVTDGITTRTHTAVDISVTDVNAENDTVSGTAPAGMQLNVHTDSPIVDLTVVTDSNGIWLADLTGLVDLQPGSSGDIKYINEQGETRVSWQVTNARVQVGINTDYVMGYGWPIATTITLTIDDPSTPASIDYSASDITSPAPWNSSIYRVNFPLNGIYDVKPGDIVSVTDGVTTRTHTVVDISVTDVNAEDDTISGTAPAGMQLYVHGDSPIVDTTVVTDSNGIWLADLTGLVDLQPGVVGDVQYRDEQGETCFRWEIQNPRVQVRINDDYIFSYFWDSNDIPITMTIDDPSTPATVDYQASEITSPMPGKTNTIWVVYNLAGIYDVKPGDIVSVTDGVITRTHTAVDLMVTDVNPGDDTVSGTAPAGADLSVNIFTTLTSATTTADTNGIWTYDFTGTVDLVSGMVGYVRYEDTEGETQVIWQVQNPRVQVGLDSDSVWGYDWPASTSISLSIDDPATPSSVDYSTSGTTEETGNDSDVLFNLSGIYDIKPGDIVNLTDGETTRTHTAVDISVTDVNAENDTVSGTAPAGMELYVHSGTDKFVVADTNGNWIADFSGMVDLIIGTTGNVQYRDEQGETAVHWEVVPETGTITGKVTAANGGESLQGINVCIKAFDEPYLDAGCFVSDENGDYSASNIQAGDYYLFIEQDGWARQYYNNTMNFADRQRVSVSAGTTLENFNFSLQPGGSISGTISNGGIPVENAPVQLDLNTMTLNTCSDVNGNYSFTSIPYGIEILLAAGGSEALCTGGPTTLPKKWWDNKDARGSADILILGESNSDLIEKNIDFGPGITISGRVMTSGTQSIGISGVTISLGEYFAATDENGEYTLTNIAAGTSGDLTASKAGWNFTPITINDITGSLTDQDFIATVFTISGKVLDVNSKPVDGVIVSFESLNTLTDGQGIFEIFNIPEGTSGDLSASKSGWSLSNPIHFDNLSEDKTLNVFIATALYTISGTVLDSTRVPIEGATISLGSLETTSNVDGSYTLADVPYGTVGTLTAAQTGFSFNVISIPSMTANLTLKNFTGTTAKYTISGTVRTVEGVGISGVVVSLGTLMATTTTTGAYTILNVPHGTSGSLTATKTGATFTSPIDVPELTDNLVNQDFTSTSLFTISGTVLDSTRVPIQGATITLGFLTTTSNIDGSYTLANVPYGIKGIFSAAKTGFTFTSISLPSVTTNLTLKNFTGTTIKYKISGTVKTAGGVGISGVVVNLGTLKATTTTTGVYTILNVPHGTMGSLTATKTGVTFTGPLDVPTLTDNLVGQDFTSTSLFTIRGTVQDSTRVPIEGATITLGSLTTTSNVDGSYTLVDVPYGTKGILSAAKTGFTFTSISIPSVTASLTLKNFTGTTVKYKISGTVRTVEGVGISGVVVNLGTIKATTTSTGVYTIINVPHGTTGSLTATKTGVTFTGPLDVPALTDNLVDQDFTSTSLFTIRGTVLDSTTVPIEGATITLGSLTTTSNVDGSYTLVDVPYGTKGVLSVTKSGWKFTPATVPALIGNLINWNFKGTALYNISGLVIDGSAQPVSGVTVKFGTLSTISDETGFFVITGIPEKSVGSLIASKLGWTFNKITVPTLIDHLSNQLFLGNNFKYSISGKTIDKSGKPISNTTITFGELTAFSDNLGVYKISEIPGGTSGSIVATKTGWTFTPIIIPALTTNLVNKNLVGSIAISGKVTELDGITPLSGVTIKLGTQYSTVTDSSGVYVLNNIPYLTTGNLTATKAGVDFGTSTIYIPPITSNLTEQNFTGSTRMYTISGKVTTAEGTNMEGVAITLGTLSTLTDSDGEYNLPNIPYGTTGKLTASKAGFLFSNPITITAITSNLMSKNFVVSTGYYSISGVVYDFSGAVPTPLKNVVINVSTGGTVTTGTNGAYIISNLTYDEMTTITLIPILSGYTFYPGSLSFTGIDSNQTYKNFVGYK